MLLTRVSLLLKMRDLSDKNSWREFVSIYTPVIKNTIRKYGVNQVDAEDILQEVLLQLMKAIPQFHKDVNKGRFRSYLCKLTANKVKDCWRRTKGKQQHIEEPALIPVDDDYEEIWECELHRSLFQVALRRTQQKSQLVTWTCFYEHVLKKRSAVAVAEELKLSENAVFINSSRTIARVRSIALKLKREHCSVWE